MRQTSIQELAMLAQQQGQSVWATAYSVGREPTIFLHWSAGHYGQFHSDYHINVDYDGSIYLSVDDLSTTLSHTWHQNTGNIGIAIAACADANTNNLGSEPPTQAQIESMSQVVAVLTKYLNIPCDYNHVRTHCEQAEIDGYGPSTTCERWDGWFWFNGDELGSGGNLVRGNANFYMNQV